MFLVYCVQRKLISCRWDVSLCAVQFFASSVQYGVQCAIVMLSPVQFAVCSVCVICIAQCSVRFTVKFYSIVCIVKCAVYTVK